MMKKKIKLLELVPKELQDKYGNVFMGEYPEFASKQDSEIETNTASENTIIDLLDKWINSSEIDELDAVMDKFKPFIPEIEKIASENEWLKVPAGTTIYRGTHIRGDEGKRVWQKLLFESKSVRGIKVSNEPKRKLMSSWSTKLPKAKEFSNWRGAKLHIHKIDPYIKSLEDPELGKWISRIIMDTWHNRDVDFNRAFAGSNPTDIELKYPNLRNDVFISLAKLDNVFPVTLKYIVKPTDCVLFPKNYLEHFIEYHRKGASISEAEVLFINLPDRMECSIL